MNRTERRNHILQIMDDLYAEAKDSKDFTMETIAKRGGVSKVWAYRLIGLEYRKLRVKLRKRSDASNKLKRLRSQKNADKSLQLQNIKTYEAESASDLSATIKCIELLDEQNRGLHGLVKIYQRRLKEAGLVIEPPMTTKSTAEEEQREIEILRTEHEQYETDLTIKLENVIESISDYSN
jgi:hypothetical protein